MAKIETAKRSVAPTTNVGAQMQQANLLDLTRRPALKTTQMRAEDLYDPRGDTAMADAIGNVGDLFGAIGKDIQNRKNNLELTKGQLAIDKFFNDMRIEAKENPRTDMIEYGSQKAADQRSLIENSVGRANREKLLAYYDNEAEKQRVWDAGHELAAIGRETDAQFQESLHESKNSILSYDLGSNPNTADLMLHIDTHTGKLNQQLLNAGYDKVQLAQKQDDIRKGIYYGLEGLIHSNEFGAEAVSALLDPSNKDWFLENLEAEDISKLNLRIEQKMSGRQTEFNKKLRLATNNAIDFLEKNNQMPPSWDAQKMGQAVNSELFNGETQRTLRNRLDNALTGWIKSPILDRGLPGDSLGKYGPVYKESLAMAMSAGRTKDSFDKEWDSYIKERNQKAWTTPAEYLANNPDFKGLEGAARDDFLISFMQDETSMAYVPQVISDDYAKVLYPMIARGPAVGHTSINEEGEVVVSNGVAEVVSKLYQGSPKLFGTVADQVAQQGTELSQPEVMGILVMSKEYVSRAKSNKMTQEEAFSSIAKGVRTMRDFSRLDDSKTRFDSMLLNMDENAAAYYDRHFIHAFSTGESYENKRALLWAAIADSGDFNFNKIEKYLENGFTSISSEGDEPHILKTRPDIDVAHMRRGIRNATADFKDRYKEYGSIGAISELVERDREALLKGKTDKSKQYGEEWKKKQYENYLNKVIWMDDASGDTTKIYATLKSNMGTYEYLTDKKGVNIFDDIKDQGKIIKQTQTPFVPSPTPGIPVFFR